eukprot:INCI5128.1.p1 GENE.INCI5128.1~~INCI5128.1.p1  ORF type:complete len:1015 (-),score=158.96 INCI5128.1:479-3523(-)
MDVAFRAAVMGHHAQPSNGKVVYEIVVVALNFESAEASRRWTVEARFSDFHALHTRLKKVTSSCVLQRGNEYTTCPSCKRTGARCPVCSHFVVFACCWLLTSTHAHGRTDGGNRYLPKVPPKKVFGAKGESFLANRQEKLDQYIRALLRCSASREPQVERLLRSFLQCNNAHALALNAAVSSTTDQTKSPSPPTTAVSRSTLQASTAKAVSSSFYETFSLCPFCIVGQQRKQRTWLAAQVKYLSAGSAGNDIHPQAESPGRHPTVFALGPHGDSGDMSASLPRDTPGVWLCAKCQIHGDIQTMYCSDVPFFQKLFRYNVVLEDQLATGGATNTGPGRTGAELKQLPKQIPSVSQQQPSPQSSNSAFHSIEHYNEVMAYAKMSRQNSDEIAKKYGWNFWLDGPVPPSHPLHPKGTKPSDHPLLRTQSSQLSLLNAEKQQQQLPPARVVLAELQQKKTLGLPPCFVRLNIINDTTAELDFKTNTEIRAAIKPLQQRRDNDEYFVLQVACGTSTDMETYNAKVEFIITLLPKTPVWMECPLLQMQLLCRLGSGSMLLNPWTYPCLHVHVMRGEEAEQTHNLSVILRMLTRISNIQIMVRLTIDRPFPDLSSLTAVLRNNTHVRLVLIQQERSPMHLLSAFSKAARAHQNQAAARRRQLLEQEQQSRLAEETARAEEQAAELRARQRASSNSLSEDEGIVGDVAAFAEEQRQRESRASEKNQESADEALAASDYGNVLPGNDMPITGRSPTSHSDGGYDADADLDEADEAEFAPGSVGSQARVRRGNSCGSLERRGRRRASSKDSRSSSRNSSSRGLRRSPISPGTLSGGGMSIGSLPNSDSKLVAPLPTSRRLSSETTARPPPPPPNSVDVFEVVQCLEHAFGGDVNPSDFLPLCMLDACAPFFDAMTYGSYNFRCPAATCFGMVLVNLHPDPSDHDVNRGPTSIPLGRFVDLETFHEMLRPLVRGFRKTSVRDNNFFQNVALVLKLKKIASRTARPCVDPLTGRYEYHCWTDRASY